MDGRQPRTLRGGNGVRNGHGQIQVRNRGCLEQHPLCGQHSCVDEPRADGQRQQLSPGAVVARHGRYKTLLAESPGGECGHMGSSAERRDNHGHTQRLHGKECLCKERRRCRGQGRPRAESRRPGNGPEDQSFGRCGGRSFVQRLRRRGHRSQTQRDTFSRDDRTGDADDYRGQDGPYHSDFPNVGCGCPRPAPVGNRSTEERRECRRERAPCRCRRQTRHVDHAAVGDHRR